MGFRFKKEVVMKKVEYGGDVVVRVLSGYQGCWQELGLIMKVGGVCVGILFLGIDF